MPSIQKPDEREGKRAELARANELISQLKTEIRVLQVRSEDIRRGIEEDSARRKLELEKELADTREHAERQLEPLANERSKLQNQIGTFSSDLREKESQVMGLTDQISAGRTLAEQLRKEAVANKAERDKAEMEKIGITAEITKLRSNIQPLKEDIASLTEELAGAKQRREDASWELTALQADLNAKKVSLTRDIDGLEHTRRDLATNINVEKRQIEDARQILAEWELKLQKREKIVSAREYRAATKEEQIASNANLLNM